MSDIEFGAGAGVEDVFETGVRMAARNPTAAISLPVIFPTALSTFSIIWNFHDIG